MGVETEVLKNIFKKPFTEKYPKEKIILPKRFRGKLSVNWKKCVECGLCKMICPADAITLGMKIKKIKSDDVIYKKILHPIISIDMGKCVSCGLCVEICPVKIISFTNEFEMVQSSKKDLLIK
jgi:NADH-quinone oxidoreductase subunit I